MNGVNQFSLNGDNGVQNGRHFGKETKSVSPLPHQQKPNSMAKKSYVDFIPAKVEVKLGCTSTGGADYACQIFPKNLSAPIDINRQQKDRKSDRLELL